MSDSKLEFELRVWGTWVENNIHYQGHPRDNILYRAFFQGGSPGKPGHKILHDCPHPVWYCFPVNDDNGKRYTKQEYATELGISYEAFKKRLMRGRKSLQKLLLPV